MSILYFIYKIYLYIKILKNIMVFQSLIIWVMRMLLIRMQYLFYLYVRVWSNSELFYSNTYWRLRRLDVIFQFSQHLKSPNIFNSYFVVLDTILRVSYVSLPSTIPYSPWAFFFLRLDAVSREQRRCNNSLKIMRSLMCTILCQPN